jgi:DNA-binding NarL/FixJ family response regulator
MTLDRSPNPLQLMVIEADPLLRLGLVTGLSRFSDLRVVEVETAAIALRLLADRRNGTEMDVILLGLNSQTPVEVCQSLKPYAPILLVGALSETGLLSAFEMGVEGYCPPGSSVTELVQAIRRVAAGETAWNLELLQSAAPVIVSPLAVLRQNTRSSGLRQIEAALAQLTEELRSSSLSPLNRALLMGQRRELRAAKWLVKKLLPPADLGSLTASEMPILRSLPKLPLPEPTSQIIPEAQTEPISAMTPRDWQAQLFDRVSAKLQSSLVNLTSVPLEIDIFKLERKRELFYSVLRQIEASLDELRFSQVQSDQLVEKRSVILRDLWQAVTTEFFGRYYTLQSRQQEIEVVPALLQSDAVQTQILDRIPLFLDLYNFLLFQAPLTIDNTTHSATSSEAFDRATDLLENLTIQLANAVVQPLLNRFSDVEAIKQNFYDRRLLSTREIERFRNDLSWRYRVDRYLNDPKAMFESRYSLLVFTPQGIGQLWVYTPRGEELEHLSGIRLGVTLALETRDAIAPRLRSAIAFVGSGVVYLLTEVIGRGIGLIGRGIVKGIGNAWQDKRKEF